MQVKFSKCDNPEQVIKVASSVTARKDDAAAADQAATAKVGVSVSVGCDGGLIQTTPG